MHTKARKVMIIGAGNVGASAAYALLNQSICEELILVDLNQQRAEAHAQDLSDAAAYLPGMMTISTREASDCADVDIAVITVSGGRCVQARAGWMNCHREDSEEHRANDDGQRFNGIFLVATNPCDIITWQVWQLSGLPRSQVLGTGVWLDTTRLRRAGAGAGYWRPEHRRFYSRRTWRYPVSGLVALVGLRFPIADVYLKHTGQPLDREQIAEKGASWL
jgi:L-lactate dehydrogenase